MAKKEKMLALLDKLSDTVDVIRAELAELGDNSPDNDREMEEEDSIHGPTLQTVTESGCPFTAEQLGELRKRLGIDKKINDDLNLNPNYTFENFVVGTSNKLAHAASLAVAEMPGEAYNPFFIYGALGLGKTHLLHAIANNALEHRPNLNIILLSAEKFVNEFIQAIMSRQIRQFQEKLRAADMLLVDDVQFFNGKEKSQEEFFHTFNELREDGRQIVLTSDRAPSDMKNISERLTVRFSWGLVTDIRAPDEALRIKVLKKKAALKGYSFPDDVIQFLAQKKQGNIRELEGALNRVIINSETFHEPATVENVSAWFAIHDIASTIEEESNLKSGVLFSNKRTKKVVLAHQVAIYLCREMTNASLLQIVTAFGLKDHTSVIHAQRKIAEQLKTDTELQRVVENIKAKLSE